MTSETLFLDCKSCDRFQLRPPLGRWIAESNMQRGAVLGDCYRYCQDPFVQTAECHVAVHIPHDLLPGY